MTENILKTERAGILERDIFNIWKKDGGTQINLAFGFKADALDIPRLERAINNIVERHPRLRSTFFEKNGDVFRNTLQKIRVDLEEFRGKDLRGFIRPFDLCNGPLLRAAVLPDKQTVLLDICHIATDGFSMAVFFSELDAIYSSREPDRAQMIPDDDGAKILENTEFWTKNLLNGFKPLILPTDKNGGFSYSGEGSSLTHKIGKKLTSAVRTRCKTLSITPFVFYLSAFLLFLSRECGQMDIVTTTNLSGRGGRTMRSIGLLASLVPVRSKIEIGTDSRGFLKKTDAQVREFLAHQKFDSEKLLKTLGFSDMRDISRTTFSFEHERIARITLGGKKCSFVPIPSLHSSCDLTLCFFPLKTESILLLIFRADRFSHARARMFARNYVNAVRFLLEN